MSLNRLFNSIDELRTDAHLQAAFGDPQVFDDKTIIPVARVGYGFGLGFGQKEEPDLPDGETGSDTQPNEGGGGGGGSSTKPLGAIVVTEDRVYFEPALNTNLVTLAGIALGALTLVQIMATVRAVFGRG